VVSGVLAGYIGQYYGWRAAFWWFGGAGLVLAAILARRLRDLPGPYRSTGAPADARDALRAYLHNRSALLLTVAFCSMVFVNIGCLTWMPTYLHERYGMPVGQAGFASMFYLHAAAFCGVLAAGPLSDRLAQRDGRARAFMQAGGLLAAAPFLYWLATARDAGAACLALAGVGLFRGVYEANIYAALHDVVPPRYHATATSAMIAIAYLLGCASPIALGAIKQQTGLASGITYLPVVLLPGALAAIAAARIFYVKDQASATAP
jgi:sugar phosphate permease